MLYDVTELTGGEPTRILRSVTSPKYDGLDHLAGNGWKEYAPLGGWTAGAGYSWHVIGREADECVVQGIDGSQEAVGQTVNVFVTRGSDTADVKIIGIQPGSLALAEAALQRVAECLGDRGD